MVVRGCRVVRQTANEQPVAWSDSWSHVSRGVCLRGRRGWLQRGWREMVSLSFSTSCLFTCVRMDCQRWYEVHVGGKKIPLLLIDGTSVNDESFYNFQLCLS